MVVKDVTFPPGFSQLPAVFVSRDDYPYWFVMQLYVIQELKSCHIWCEPSLKGTALLHLLHIAALRIACGNSHKKFFCCTLHRRGTGFGFS
jgi:hypothetical protein